MHKLTPNPRAHCSAFGYGVGHLSGRAPTMCERALDTPRAQPGFPHPTIARKPFIDSTVFAPVSELIRSRIGDQSTCLSCQSLASVSMVSQRALHYQPASTSSGCARRLTLPSIESTRTQNQVGSSYSYSSASIS